jgi:GntR family transcriptional regulator
MQIAAQYKVSRITVRRAIKDLIEQGVLYSLQGKGTFVAREPIRDMTGYRSFSEDIRSKGMQPSSRVLQFTLEPASNQAAALLQLAPGEMIYILQRIRLAGGQPVAFESAHLPARLFPNLDQYDFARRSLFEVFGEAYRIYPAWADAEIQATAAPPEVAQRLEIRSGDPVLTAHRLTYTETFEIIEYVVSIYCGNRFTFYTGRQPIR